MVLRDPPEVKQYAKRGDPPMDQWPGRVVTREDLMKAGGDPRDWFRYGHRLKAYEEAWAEFADALLGLLWDHGRQARLRDGR